MDALEDDFNGTAENGDLKITIGDSIYASRFSAVISNMNNGILLRSVKVSTDGTNWYDVVTLDIDELPTLTKSDTYIKFVVV